MLFTILISLFSLLFFFLRGFFARLGFRISAGKKARKTQMRIPLVIFSDNKRYWNVYEPICEELESRGIQAVYMTASEDDPALGKHFTHVGTEFIGTGNKALARMNMIRADVVLSTTPGLDVYQWRRSREAGRYVHIPHAASDLTLYRMFGIDYYDAVLLSGEYQGTQIRALEKLRKLPEKELVYAGIPYFDRMAERLEKSGNGEKNRAPGFGWTAEQKKAAGQMTGNEGSCESLTVLLAPSWGKNGLLSKYGEKLLGPLLETGYHIIIRPHPQSEISEKKMLDQLKEQFPESDRVSWNRDNDNFEVLRRSDIMISDFSGVLFDYALVFDKPVIYTNTEFDKSVYDCWFLDEELWTIRILPQIGRELAPSDFNSIGLLIRECLGDERLQAGREKARTETWMYRGEGAKRAVDYIEKLLIREDRSF